MPWKHNGRAPRCLRDWCEFESRPGRQIYALADWIGAEVSTLGFVGSTPIEGSKQNYNL